QQEREQDRVKYEGTQPALLETFGAKDRLVEAEDVVRHFQVIQTHEEKSRQKLDEEITHRELRPALPAFAAKEPIAQQRQIVVPANGLQTMAAARAGPE